MKQDNNGFLIFGTREGAFRYDGVTLENLDIKNKLPSKRVSDLIPEENGDIWLGTLNGLAKYSKNRIHIVEKLKNKRILKLFKDKDDNLWIGTWTGLYKLDKNNNLDVFLKDYKISAFCIDVNNRIWIGSDRGFFYTDNFDKNFKEFPFNKKPAFLTMIQARDGKVWVGGRFGIGYILNNKYFPLKNKNGFEFKIVFDIFEDRDGNIWIGSFDGISLYDGKVVTDYQNHEGIFSNRIIEIFQDNEGNIWNGSIKGVRIFNGHKFSFYSVENGLSQNWIFSILKSKKGDYYFGTWNKGISVFSNNKWGNLSRENGMSGNSIISIIEDKNNNILFGTSENGISVYNGNEFKILKKKDGLSSNRITTMYLDNDDTVWVGSTLGISILKDGKIVKTITEKNGLPNNYIRVILRDQKGFMWFGSIKGLFKYDGSKFTVYNERDGLPLEFISSLYQTKEGVLWIGSGKELSRFKNNKFVNFKPNCGILNSIMEDIYGRIWISGVDGFARFDGKRFFKYSNRDGMVSNRINMGSHLNDQNGIHWYGTNKGVLKVNMKFIKDTDPPVIYLRKILSNNKKHLHSGAILNYNKSSLTFHFVGLSYSSMGDILYKYRLLGLDDEEWKYTKQNFISFYHLPTGKFEFEVMAKNSFGIWSKNSQKFQFTILSPFWHKWWFISICSLIFLFFVILFYKYRVRRIKNQKINLEKIVSERTSELKKKNEELTSSKEMAERERIKAESANRFKSQFLAMMSHDIRTPLNSIIGFTDIVLDSKLSKDQEDYIRTIQHSSEVLVSLINDIVDFSKIEAGQININVQDFNLIDTAYEICEMFSPRVFQKGIELIFDVQTGFPQILEGDPSKFRQIIINLIGNAIKFTKEGEIELYLDYKLLDKEKAEVIVKVRDTGIGIPKDKQGKVFELFQQADRSIEREFGGSGLGLAICNLIAKKMGGDIKVESELDKGSTFIFSTIMNLVEKESVRIKKEYDFSDIKLLFFESNKRVRTIFENSLKKVKIKYTSIDNHLKTEDYLKEGKFTFCLFDVDLENKDVIEYYKKIKTSGIYPELKIIILSSSPRINWEYCIKNNIDAFIKKPVLESRLFEIIDDILGDSFNISEKLASDKELVEGNENKHLNILLVEDNIVNQKLAIHLLSKFGYLLTIAVNGKEAFELFSQNPYYFDVVLMDIQMPIMNGVEATQKIRELEKSINKEVKTPIIAMTANVLKGDRETYLKAGMDDYLSKPIKGEDIKNILEKWGTK